MSAEPSRRAVIIDDDREFIRAVQMILRRRGYEVHTATTPRDFPLYTECVCRCPEGHACAHIILTDVDLPGKSIADFLKMREKGGCRVDNIGLMSTGWTESEADRWRQHGYKLFVKPFKIRELTGWLDECEAKSQPDYKLTNLDPDSPAAGS